MIANQLPEVNPYSIAEPAGQDRPFYGRDPLFTWIQAALLQVVPEQGPPHPVILRGPRHIGKSSILKQIEAGQLNPPYTAVYIDLADLTMDSLSAFLWDMAQTAVNRLEQLKIELPSLNHTLFIGDPFRAFREQLLLPATVALNETNPTQNGARPSSKLLFLLDNLHILAAKIESGVLKEDTFTILHETIYKNHMAACLSSWEMGGQTALRSQTASGGQTALRRQTLASPVARLFFDQAQIYDVGPLTAEDAVSLVRQPMNGTIFKNVAEYIVNLTQNRPYETQLLCYELFERRQHLNLNLITVADVLAVQHSIVESGLYNSQLGATSQPAFHISPKGNAIQSVQRTTRRAIWQQWPFIGGVLLLLAAVALLVGVPWLTGQSWREQMAIWGGNGESAVTAVAAIPPTAQIVVIVASPTPQPTPTATLTPTPSRTPIPTNTATPTNTPTVTLTPLPSVLPPSYIRQQDNMPMLLIPGTEFLMGSGENDFPAAPDERPQHPVTLTTFYMDQYEVSVEQFAAMLNRLGGYSAACDGFDCGHPRHIAGNSTYLLQEDLGDGTVQFYPLTGFANYPINHVSWHGASFYCQSVGGRLPTEAEWEYAARGTDGRVYPWGNEPPNKEKAVYQSDSFDDLLPVDALPRGASPFGVFGMSGSMWEWVSDWYQEDYYAEISAEIEAGNPAINPPGPETGISKTMRGGAWPYNNQKDRVRTTNRSSLDPTFFSSTVGFRCVVEP